MPVFDLNSTPAGSGETPRHPGSRAGRKPSPPGAARSLDARWYHWVTAVVFVVGLLWLVWSATQNATGRIQSRAPAGAQRTHYEPEFGPHPGLLESLKRSGRVPPDAVDDGKGHFVSPSQMSPAEREAAAQIVQMRNAHRAAIERQPSPTSPSKGD